MRGGCLMGRKSFDELLAEEGDTEGAQVFRAWKEKQAKESMEFKVKLNGNTDTVATETQFALKESQ